MSFNSEFNSERVHGEIQEDLSDAKNLLEEAYEMTIVDEEKDEIPDWLGIVAKVNSALGHTDNVGTNIEFFVQGGKR